MTEQWKPIPGYEGLYDASSWGRIRSAPGKTTRSARFPVRVWKSRIMKEKHPVSRKRQDARVSLWKDGEHKDYLVSRLVASAWHGLPDDGMTVNHINGDWKDNRPENLEWLSQADNIHDALKNGLFDSFCSKTVLIDEDGNKTSFRSMAEASRFLGRNIGYISCVLSRSNCIATSVSGDRYFIAYDERE